MDKEHVKGAADKAKGTIEDTAGKVTGDKGLQTDGKIDKAKGAVHDAVGDVKDATKKAMKFIIVALAFSVALPVSAFAQDAPPFFKAITPQADLNASWQDFMAINNPKGALDTKTKELISLGVAAQIPCQYCIYYHTLAAKHAGATDDQIKEAVAASALVRKLSTELNGNQYDINDFKKQVDGVFGNANTKND